jgi:heat shock protein HtpX
MAHQSKVAKIGMPEIAIWNFPEVNAFTTGMNKNKALIAALHRQQA